MTPDEIKEILSVYRPGSADDADPEFAEALTRVEEDAELSRWFKAHCDSYRAMKEKLRSSDIPQDLKQRILAGRKIAPLPARPRFLFVWAAAAVLMIGVGMVVFRQAPPPRPSAFESFRTRMVGTALRQYGMDIVTNSADVVRQFMIERGVPSDYVLSETLDNLKLSGGGALRWRDHPVSMLCFDRGDSQMLFLFVIDSSALGEAPLTGGKVNQLETVVWKRGPLTYLLAGPEEPGFSRKYP